MENAAIQYDVVIVGAGPAGLSAAIELKLLAQKQNKEITVCILEKAANVGDHILSGAVFNPRALTALLPDWKALGAPLHTTVKHDKFYYLSQRHAYRLPILPTMHNQGNYIISLGQLCRFLAVQAESLGIEIYTGFPAASLLINDDNRVCGVKTGDMGIEKSGQPGPRYQAGMAIGAELVLLAEGCRGSLSQEVIARYQLAQNDPQTYALGLKEIWEVDSSAYQPGTVTHTVGWPLNQSVYGGSFIYHLNDQHVSVGLVVGLDYKNPTLSPYESFQQWKHHPLVSRLLSGGKRLSYGARALTEGGYQSIPRCDFPGGLLIGCAAGFMNVPQIKGSHTAMQSGIIAAEVAFETLKFNNPTAVNTFNKRIDNSWVGQELKAVRNIRPSFKWGLWSGMIYSALDTLLFHGKTPWTFHHKADHLNLTLANRCQKIHYPKPDGILSFDKMTNLSFSNVSHEENQPSHLQLKDPSIPLSVNWPLYAGPEQHYCPAGVYEYIQKDDGTVQFRINAQNCIHCKTCDIKDPKQNIHWVPPEGGGGPGYSDM